MFVIKFISFLTFKLFFLSSLSLCILGFPFSQRRTLYSQHQWRNAVEANAAEAIAVASDEASVAEDAAVTGAAEAVEEAQAAAMRRRSGFQ